jgi:AcrR family transcriptional regulator
MSMTKSKSTIDQIRRDAGRAMMSCLNDHRYQGITIDMIAAETGHQATVIRRLFPDMAQMVDQGLRDLDDDVMATFADDLAEDLDSGTRERILEGLIVRYEAYRDYKAAIKNLNSASVTNALLATLSVQRLSAVSKTILELAGDNTSGITGLLRVKGLVAVTLVAQRAWLKDESPDMAATTRVLDQRLKQAEELAEMFNLIPSASAESGRGDGTTTG